TPPGSLTGHFQFSESPPLGASAPVSGLDLPLPTSAPAALPATPPTLLDGTAARTVVIDSDNLTVTGDGDGDPHKFYGQPFTASVNGGIAQFVIPGDLHIPADTVTVHGANAASVVVGGNGVIDPGAVFDVSANGQTPGAGGGRGGNAGPGGTGGGGGAAGGWVGGGVAGLGDNDSNEGNPAGISVPSAGGNGWDGEVGTDGGGG